MAVPNNHVYGFEFSQKFLIKADTSVLVDWKNLITLFLSFHEHTLGRKVINPRTTHLNRIHTETSREVSGTADKGKEESRRKSIGKQ